MNACRIIECQNETSSFLCDEHIKKPPFSKIRINSSVYINPTIFKKNDIASAIQVIDPSLIQSNSYKAQKRKKTRMLKSIIENDEKMQILYRKKRENKKVFQFFTSEKSEHTNWGETTKFELFEQHLENHILVIDVESLGNVS